MPCHHSNNSGLEMVGYITFSVCILPITCFLYFIYHGFLPHALGSDYTNKAIVSKFKGPLTNISILFHGLVVSSMITTVIVTAFTYLLECNEHSIHPFSVIQYIITWCGGLTFYMIIWLLEISNNHEYLIEQTDNLKDKAKALSRKYISYIVSKFIGVASGAAFVKNVYYNDVECICVDESKNDLLVFTFIITISIVMGVCCYQCDGEWTVCFIFAAAFGIIVGLPAVIVWRFMLYAEYLEDLAMMKLKYKFEWDDIVFFWTVMQTLVFVTIHIWKWCKEKGSHGEENNEHVSHQQIEQSEHSDDGWECTQCTFINKSENVHCQMCFSDTHGQRSNVTEMVSIL
eukprot:396975_1